MTKKDTLEIQTSLKAYLYRAVHNAGLNRVKQNAVRKTYAADARFTMSLYTDETGEPDELKEKINQAIDHLPEQCGKIFRMSRFEEMKYQEIADALDISVKTVENQMGKALKILRETLRDYLSVLLIILGGNL